VNTIKEQLTSCIWLCFNYIVYNFKEQHDTTSIPQVWGCFICNKMTDQVNIPLNTWVQKTIHNMNVFQERFHTFCNENGDSLLWCFTDRVTILCAFYVTLIWRVWRKPRQIFEAILCSSNRWEDQITAGLSTLISEAIRGFLQFVQMHIGIVIWPNVIFIKLFQCGGLRDFGATIISTTLILETKKEAGICSRAREQAVGVLQNQTAER
jgi:hypothetical protein